MSASKEKTITSTAIAKNTRRCFSSCDSFAFLNSPKSFAGFSPAEYLSRNCAVTEIPSAALDRCQPLSDAILGEPGDAPYSQFVHDLFAVCFYRLDAERESGRDVFG